MKLAKSYDSASKVGIEFIATATKPLGDDPRSKSPRRQTDTGNPEQGTYASTQNYSTVKKANNDPALKNKYIHAWETYSTRRLRYESNFNPSATTPNLHFLPTPEAQISNPRLHPSPGGSSLRNLSANYANLLSLKPNYESLRPSQTHREKLLTENCVSNQDHIFADIWSHRGKTNQNSTQKPLYKSSHSKGQGNQSETKNFFNKKSASNLYSSQPAIYGETKNLKGEELGLAQSNVSVTQRREIREILEGRQDEDAALREYFDYKLKGIQQLGLTLSDQKHSEFDGIERTITTINRDTKTMLRLRDLFSKKNSSFKRRNVEIRETTISKVGELNMQFLKLSQEWKAQTQKSAKDIARREQEFTSGLQEFHQNNHDSELRMLESFKQRGDNLKSEM